METLREHISNSLPETFSFYHLGEVRLSHPGPESAETDFIEASRQAIAFTFRGEMRAVLITFFEQGLDSSIYSELGNVLASQLASRLYERSGLHVMISAPIALQPERVRKLLEQAQSMNLSVIRRCYQHHYAGMSLPIQTWIIEGESVV